MSSAAYAHGQALRASDREGAERALRLAADLGEAAGNRWIRAFALTEVSWLVAQRGRLADGLQGFAEVVDLWCRGGDWANQWLSMRHVLGVFTELGAHHAAAVIHGPWSWPAWTQPFPSNPPTPTSWWQKPIGRAKCSARWSSTPPCAGAPP